MQSIKHVTGFVADIPVIRIEWNSFATAWIYVNNDNYMFKGGQTDLFPYEISLDVTRL